MSAKRMIEIAGSQVGYLEKKTDANLDQFTAPNDGNGNWTKFGRWYGLNPADWCEMFISWCADQAGELAAVGKFSYVPSHIAFFKRQGRWFARGTKTPIAGDIIFFGDEAHVGLVESVSGTTVRTIEGNTKNSAGIGGVMRHSYSLTSTYIMGYGRPGYSGGSEKPADEWPEIKTFAEPKTYSNGSTIEKCFADIQLDPDERTGSLNTWEECKCLGVIGGRYLVLYRKDGTEDFKIGLCEYSGEVES